MALELDLSYSQSNNAVTLTVTDSAGTYTPDNLTGWGDPNPRASFTFADIVTSADVATYVPVKYHLILDVTVTDKNNTSTTYDTINLWNHDGTGPFTSAADLTWDFNPSDFVSGGTAMGVATDKLDDGIYAISYKLVQNDNHSTEIDSVSESIKVDGDVRFDVYNKLRQVSTDYDCEENDKSYEHMEALMADVYLRSIDASAAVSETENLANQLWTLDKMVSDGSKYTW
jgi:hypothetical protein